MKPLEKITKEDEYLTIFDKIVVYSLILPFVVYDAVNDVYSDLKDYINKVRGKRL